MRSAGSRTRWTRASTRVRSQPQTRSASAMRSRSRIGRVCRWDQSGGEDGGGNGGDEGRSNNGQRRSRARPAPSSVGRFTRRQLRCPHAVHSAHDPFGSIMNGACSPHRTQVRTSGRTCRTDAMPGWRAWRCAGDRTRPRLPNPLRIAVQDCLRHHPDHSFRPVRSLRGGRKPQRSGSRH
jgi:hypothetical protein